MGFDVHLHGFLGDNDLVDQQVRQVVAFSGKELLSNLYVNFLVNVIRAGHKLDSEEHRRPFPPSGHTASDGGRR